MKILLVHNFYGSSAPSGENMAFEAEKELLRINGHEVVEFTRHSDEIRNGGIAGLLNGALSVAWNPFTSRKMKSIVKREQPDVMHVHNFFPLISPSVFHALQGTKTAAVFTLHNYRIVCASAIPMRKDMVCMECLESRSVLPALKYGCYRNSKAATLPLAAMIELHRRLRTWDKSVDAFIALSEFQRKTFISAGLPHETIHVKPHFYADPPVPLPWKDRSNKIIYIGRLSDEKGVDVLIKAWKSLGDSAPDLEIIGEGPDKYVLKELVKGTSMERKITFTGQLTFDETQKRLAAAKFLILPSRCFEGFPMVIREAFALGVPVIASRIGSIADIVSDNRNGILFEPGNDLELRQIMERKFQNMDQLQAMQIEARREFESKYTAETNINMLVGIYDRAIEHKKNKK